MVKDQQQANGWTIARVKVEGRETLQEKYQEFVLLFDGQPIGKLKWTYRPKNAGGPAWQAKLIGLGECNSDISYYDSNKAKSLAWAKQAYPGALARRQQRDARFAAE